MRMRVGCRMSYDIPAPTPMILLVNVHYSRASDLERPDHLVTEPTVPVEGYRDSFGNWCNRLVAPAGRFTVSTDAYLQDDGTPDPVAPDAPQVPVELLPSDTLGFLLPSRYCESDVLSDFAWSRFGNTPEGWARVQAVCDFVHNHVTFDYEQARDTRTAVGALEDRVGVCRDFAHLAVALCRALNIPTRYCNGYVSDIGNPPAPVPDFAAWMEVYLGGRWWTFDPRNNDKRYGRVLISRGRDAADVPLTHSFGLHDLAEFTVWTKKVED